MEDVSQWVVLAHILRPQGRRGEVLADLLTDFPARFDQHPRVWLAAAGFAGPSAVEVASHWLPVGKNAGRIVLKFTGTDSIEQAEKLTGKDVLVPLSERVPLEDGAAYISDLVGCTVYDRGQPLGVVEDVQFPTTPDGLRRLEDAAPLLRISSAEGHEILVPLAKAYLLDVDLAAKAVRMALPEGLAEINRQSDRTSGKDD
jgi:16S rRNA processing protein RimM